ncbi:hypothetical protein BH09ACT8_BH09ACT8_60100 [soil metagenome]
MHSTLRPLATAGIAMVGAGALAIAPLPQVESPSRSTAQVSPAIQLAAAADILGPDQSTLDISHAAFYNLLPVLKTLGVVTISPTAQELVDFSTSSLSGVLLGLAGPIAGPSVLLVGNFQSIAADLATRDVTGALTTLIGTPAALVSAFLFGGVHLDLTALVQSVGPGLGLQFPDGVGVGIAFGGLLSPAGSVFNALDFDFSVALGSLPVGAIGLAGGTGPGAISSLAAALGNVVSAISEIPQSVVTALTGLTTPAAAPQPPVAHGAAVTATEVAAPTRLRDKATRDSVKAVPNAAHSSGGKHRASADASSDAQLSAPTTDAAGPGKARLSGPGKHAKAAKRAAA